MPPESRIRRTVLGRQLIVERVVREIDPNLVLPVAMPPITVIRAEDLFFARFSFVNLTAGTDQAGRRVLRRRRADRAAFLAVDLQPQHVIEEAFYEKPGKSPTQPNPTNPAGQNPPPQPPDPPDSEQLHLPVRALLSTHTRLVFRVTTEEIVFTLDGLLAACSSLPLSVAPHAVTQGLTRVSFAEALHNSAVGTQAVVREIGTLAGSVAKVGTVAGTLAAARTLEARLGGTRAGAAIAGLGLAQDLQIVDVLDPGQLGQLIRVRPAPRPPTDTETAIELPWRLKLSPGPNGGFAHASDPVEHDGRVELWHTRLGVRITSGKGVRVEEDDPAGRTVRAIWARDFDPNNFKTKPDQPSDFPNADGSADNPKFRKSLNSRDREMLVHETSNFTLKRQNRTWNPHPVDVDRLMLTSLGGWLSSELSSPDLPDGPFSISEWKHRATMGRDHEVKVVYAGFLFPFGHHASLVKVTERKFTPSQPGNPAFLFQRFFLIVREQTRNYHDPGVVAGRRLDYTMPLASVSILTRVTPILDDPAPNLVASGGWVFFPAVDGSPFLFKILAADREGGVVEYSAPLMFVERDHNLNGAPLQTVIQAYANASDSRRRHPLGGQRVAYAPVTAPDGRALDTILNTQNLYWDGVELTPPNWNITQDDPRFAPVLRSADVVVPSMSALVGANTPISVSYPAHYAAQGLAANAANVFLAVAGAPKLDFAGKGDRSGGLVTPNVAITALSGSTGPVGGDLTKAVAGTTTPADFFAGIKAKLFGVVPLVDLLTAVGLTPDKFPKFVGQTLDRALAFLGDLQRLVALAQEVQSRFATEADAQVTAARNALNGVVASATAVIDTISSFDADADLAGQVATLAGNLSGLAEAIDAAKQLPAAIRSEGSGLVRRLEEHVEDAADLVKVVQQFMQGIQLPPVVTARLSWSTQLAAWPASAPIFQPKSGNWVTDANARATLDLAVEVQAPTKADKQPTALVSCSITPFELRLIGDTPFISLRIERIEFLLAPGRKPDVNVVFAEPDGIVFGGPLSFVNTLREVIPFDGFSDPPYLEVDTQGIRAGFDLPIPSLTVGLFSLCNISLGAQARVPFIDDSLDFSFNFCTRENPFRMTVWLFAGGGFFGITITPEKCRVLEAAFEFGAAVALDFGVASGSIEVMAGIYFRLEDGNSQLTGYFRLRGEVDVLGLISASIELYLELTYEFPSGKAVGRASLTIEVEVLFLSFSVSISVEKKFKGSNQDPTFAQIMGPPVAGVRPWDAYCEAFIPA